MGKKQHQKDKMYLTASEWTELYGGKKADVSGRPTFRKLPFYCCSLSLQPFQHPLCTKEGVTFDLVNIVPYLKKYGNSPVTGEPLSAKELVRLNYHKNADGKYHCPVTFRIFNDNTHIVAIRNTGNVFSYEAVERLNLKAKNMRDLLTDEPFTKADIITLQDPAHPERFDLSTFYYVQNKLSVDEEEGGSADPTHTLRGMNPETKATLDALAREYKEPEKETGESSTPKEKLTSRNAAHYSTGAVAHSFTSTVIKPVTEHEAAVIERDALLYAMIKKKGYVRIHTNFGDLNFELHCDLVPKTCHNFISHCRDGYYTGTIFHRSIKNFMVQGGDPTGTGRGGRSIWKEPFNDEIRLNLKHEGRGVLSMANSGPNTNKSQFFITYRSCRHLDGKHAVFGRCVGGLDVLGEMERVPTDAQDKPKEEIKITGCEVFVDPYQEAEQKLSEEEASELEAKETKPAAEKPTKVYREGVGKYIPKAGVKRSQLDTESSGTKRLHTYTEEAKHSTKTQLTDFSAW